MSILRYAISVLVVCLELPSMTTANTDIEVVASQGETVYFYCGGISKTAQSGKWYFEKESDKKKSASTSKIPLSSNNSTIFVSPAMVEIKNVREKDVGYYYCENSSIRSHLSVKDLPSRVSNLTVSPKIEKAEDSILEIRWINNSFADPQYVLEIAEGDDIGSIQNKEWMKILRTNTCCYLTYKHSSYYRTAQLRLSVANENIRSNYAESAVFLLPNRLPRLLPEFNVFHETSNKIYLNLMKQCDIPVMNYTVRYRAMDYPLNWTENRIADPSSYAELDVCPDTDYIIQLMGEAEHKKYYSKQKFYHTAQLSSRAGALTFTKSWPLKVDFIPPAKLAVKDLKFKINVRKGNPKANATVIMNKTFPTMIDGLESGEDYFIEVAYRKGNENISYLTDLYFVRTAEGIPGSVKNFTVRLLPFDSNEYALVSARWSLPSSPNGIITGYKLRWKFTNSSFDLFFVEQCSASYNIKVFRPNTSYTAFVSAKTNIGYGEEQRVDFFVRYPPDWGYTSAANASIRGPKQKAHPLADSSGTVDRILFQAQLRQKIGHEYVIGSTRVLITCCALMVSIMFAWFIKYAFLEIKTTNERLKKLKGAAIPQIRRKSKGVETKKRKS